MLPSFTLPGRRLPRPRPPAFALLRVELLAGLVVALALIPEAISFSIIAGVDPKILLAQLPHLAGGDPVVLALVAAGLAVIVLLPRLTKAVPAPLVAIVGLPILTVAAGIGVPTVGDEGALPDTLPVLGIPSVPLTVQTLAIIAPYALTLAAVGLLESLLTAKLVDDNTETRSDKDREARGQGIANVITGFFGGMAGCAMIGQTMINVRTGGARTRLSTFGADFFLLVLIVVGRRSLAVSAPRRPGRATRTLAFTR